MSAPPRPSRQTVLGATKQRRAIRLPATPKDWAKSGAVALVLLAVGYGLTLLFPDHWYISAPVLYFGLHVGSRGYFTDFLLGLKDALVSILQARAGAAPPPEGS